MSFNGGNIYSATSSSFAGGQGQFQRPVMGTVSVPVPKAEDNPNMYYAIIGVLVLCICYLCYSICYFAYDKFMKKEEFQERN